MDKKIIQTGKWIASQLKQDKDVVVIIDGYERSGKSSLAYWLGQCVSYYTGRDFGTDNFIWRGQELVSKMWDMPEYSVIIHDEAGTDLYKRESTTKMNREINKALMVSGLRNQCIILCVPNIWDLDKFVSQRRGLMWIRVKLKYSQDGLTLIRGFATVRSHLKQSTWDQSAYWNTDFEIHFKQMPYDFKIKYKKKKKKETKQRIDAMGGNNGSSLEDTAKGYIALAIDVRDKAKELNKSGDRFTDIILREVLKKHGVKDKSYFYQVKKKIAGSEN